MSNKYSNPKGTRFFFGKGAFLLVPPLPGLADSFYAENF